MEEDSSSSEESEFAEVSNRAGCGSGGIICGVHES